jgi:hypothetical protein
VARRAGVQIDFKNPGDVAWTTVWGFIAGSDRKVGLLGGVTDTDGLDVIIPRQTSFPPTDFLPGSQIRYPISTGTVFQVDVIEEDNEENTQASTFKLVCTRFGHCTVEAEDD